MSAHTRGAWAVHEGSGGWTVYGGRLPLVAGVEVARVNADGDENDRHEADARLIAAAPDLLAACEGAMELLRCMDDPIVDAVRDAIAKARGGK